MVPAEGGTERREGEERKAEALGCFPIFMVIMVRTKTADRFAWKQSKLTLARSQKVFLATYLILGCVERGVRSGSESSADGAWES